MKCKTTGKELSDEKLYSESDISNYLRTFLKGSLSGDCFSHHPCGEEINKQLYTAIVIIKDPDYGIKKITKKLTKESE